jgi:hypothetical protein
MSKRAISPRMRSGHQLELDALLADQWKVSNAKNCARICSGV